MRLIVTTVEFDREPVWLFEYGITGYWRTAKPAPPSRDIVIEGTNEAITAAAADPLVESWRPYEEA